MLSSISSQNPFSLYDFLGYLIPGVFFIIGLSIVHQPDFINFSLPYLFKAVSIYFDSIGAIGVIFLIILSYILGHLLSYLSSMTIEKYSEWFIGYPSKYLFESIRFTSVKITFMLFWKNYLSPDIINNRPSAYANKLTKASIKLQRAFIALVLLPITIPILFLTLVGMANTFKKGLAQPLSAILRQKADEKLQELGVSSNQLRSAHGELFKLLYHNAIEKFSSHKDKMQNYVALYGFTRTISLIFVILFWVSTIRNINCVCYISFWLSNLFLMFFSIIFYLAFNKFYRKFTLECYMAVAANT